MKPTSRHRGKNPEYPTVGIKPTSLHRGKNLEYPTVGIKPTSRHRGKNPEYPTVGIKPTSLHRGKNPEYPTVGIKKTSRHRGKNPEYPTVGIKSTSLHRGKNPEYPTVGIKPTSRHRGKNPMHSNIIIEPNLRYNLVHHLITSNSMFLLTCTFFPMSPYLRLRTSELTFHNSINYIEDLWFLNPCRNLNNTPMTIFLNHLLNSYISKSISYNNNFSRGFKTQSTCPNIEIPHNHLRNQYNFQQ